MRERIIPALDVQTKEQLDFLIKELSGEAIYVKVGMELYYTFGNSIITQLKDHGFKIFLDLKLHDIPNTVYRSCKTLGKNGVDILNVHASGGVQMMKAGLEGLKESNESSLLIGVTQLTSTTENVMQNELLISESLDKTVKHYAKNTFEAGLDGIVCSALEVEKVKQELGNKFKCITPGIRPKGSSKDDQKRVMTPSEAIEAGSDFLVIGRAITQNESPKLAFKNILKEISHE